MQNFFLEEFFFAQVDNFLQTQQGKRKNNLPSAKNTFPSNKINVQRARIGTRTVPNFTATNKIVNIVLCQLVGFHVAVCTALRRSSNSKYTQKFDMAYMLCGISDAN
jgi:hypothetical protein